MRDGRFAPSDQVKPAGHGQIVHVEKFTFLFIENVHNKLGYAKILPRK